MLLLENKGQREVLDVEGQIRRVEQTQHVEFLGNLTHTPLQLANTLLLLGIGIKDVMYDLLGDSDTLGQIDLLQRGR